MSKYILYRYQFSPIHNNEDDLFLSNETIASDEELMQNKQELFASIFDNENLAFVKEKKCYNHKLLFKEGGFIIFKIAKDRSVNLEEDFTIHKHEYSPSCNVIIDNRKDVQYIAIEEKSNVFNKVDTVAKILKCTFLFYLQGYKLSIDIKRVYDVKDFWSVVEENKDKIEKIRFQFSYPNLPDLNRRVKEAIAEVAKSTTSGKSELTFEAAKGQTLHISEEDPNLRPLVQMSADGGEEIMIKTKKIWVKIGKNSKSFSIDNLDSILDKGNDLFNKVTDQIADFFNKLFR